MEFLGGVLVGARVSGTIKNGIVVRILHIGTEVLIVENVPVPLCLRQQRRCPASWIYC